MRRELLSFRETETPAASHFFPISQLPTLPLMSKSKGVNKPQKIIILCRNHKNSYLDYKHHMTKFCLDQCLCVCVAVSTQSQSIRDVKSQSSFHFKYYLPSSPPNPGTFWWTIWGLDLSWVLRCWSVKNIGLRVSECTTPFMAPCQGSVPTTFVDRAMS